MIVYRNINSVQSVRDTVLTIGTFDGLHRGHQEIIKQVVTHASAKGLKSVVITFNPHPRHVLDPGPDKLPQLVGIDKKLELLEDLRVDVVLIIPFTREFSNLTAREFMYRIVEEKFNPLHIIIGYDHHFGHQRDGSPEFLKEYCKHKSFGLEIISPISDEGSIISSTNIRNLILSGFVRRASFELGWVFGFRAQVIHGTGRGHSLNFPTANFLPVEENQLLPKSGVYLARGRVDGQQLYGMCNLGVRPTFDEGEFVMEVHFFDEGTLNLYGREIIIEFLERIRNEKKFSSKSDLIDQLEKDKNNCLELIKKYI